MLNFQDLVSIVINQQSELIILFFLLSYLFLPLLGVPMMLITYFSGFILGFKLGMFISFIGYAINMIIIYELENNFKNFKFFKKNISKIKEKNSFIKKNLSLPVITAMAMLLPYLPLLIFLGFTQTKRFLTYVAIFIGSIPSLFISLQAGHLGSEIFFGANKERIVLSISILLLTFSFHYFVIKKLGKKVI